MPLSCHQLCLLTERFSVKEFEIRYGSKKTPLGDTGNEPTNDDDHEDSDYEP